MIDKEAQKMGNRQNEQESFIDSFFKYVRYWYLFLLGLLITVGTAYVYIQHATPLYLISGTLLIKTSGNEGQLSESAAFSDLNTFKTSKNFDNEIEVLKSYRLMRRVLSKLPVNISYYVEESLKERELYGSELPIKVVAHSLDSTAYGREVTVSFNGGKSYNLEEGGKTFKFEFGEVVRRPYGTFTILTSDAFPQKSPKQKKIIVVFENINTLAKYYSDWLKVEPINAKASVLNISITDPVPERGRDVINKLMQDYREEELEGKNLIAASTIKLIDDRLNGLSAELIEIEKDVEQYKRQNKLADVASQSKVYVEESNTYQKQLAEWSVQIDVLETIETYISNSKENSYRLVPSTLSIEDPTLQELISRFNELQLERERLLRTTEKINPIILSIDQQLQSLRVNILENIHNIKGGLVLTRRNLKDRTNLYDAKINSVPLVERELQEIDRQRGIKQQLYKYLLEKREESSLALATSAPNSLVLRPAIIEGVPVEPKKQTVFLLAFIAGLGVPLASIFIKNAFNRKVQQRADVERATTAPVLGEVSYNDTKDVIVVSESSKTAIAELFRLIRTNLQFVVQGGERKVILVTSSVSGEGKTFFSLNLGASLALTGKNVVVLDFDLRKQSILADLGLACEFGITDYLSFNTVTVEEMLNQSDQVPNLFIVGSGAIPVNPAELMMSNRVEQLFEELQKKFDYILIDTAPVGQVSDAFSLSKYVDLTVCLVRYNYTPKHEIENINDILYNNKFKQPMIVLNGAKKFNSNKYGYGYGYVKK
ncbi:GumC family protein [Pontibacter ummariensis]|nr:polysaccharide biosynthesis tyrosine autokinase [Pontibacter ummariensis]